MAEKIEFGSVSYVLGILSIVLAFSVSESALILGIVGFIQSKRAKVKIAKRLNIIGIVLSLTILVIKVLATMYYLKNGVGFPAI